MGQYFLRIEWNDTIGFGKQHTGLEGVLVDAKSLRKAIDYGEIICKMGENSSTGTAKGKLVLVWPISCSYYAKDLESFSELFGKLKKDSSEDICCAACSEAGGAGLPVYHKAPECPAKGSG